MNGPGELWVNQRSDELLEISFVTDNTRECYRCKDKYVGYIGNWGVEVEGEAICLYCYYGQEERKWTPEWETMK